MANTISTKTFPKHIIYGKSSKQNEDENSHDYLSSLPEYYEQMMLYLSRPTDPSSLPCEIPSSWFDITEEDSVSKQIYKYNMIHGYLEHILPPEFWGSAFWEPGLIAEVNSLSMSEQEYEQLVNDIHTSIMKIADLINQHSRYVFYSKN